MDYIQVTTIVGMGLLGTAIGSFAGAQVWRNRTAQLKDDKRSGQKIDKQEFKRLLPLAGKGIKDDRSICLSCGHRLAWYDLLPIVSWLSLMGKCRYCKSPIGWVEFLLELSVGALFVLSWVFWPGTITDPLGVIKLVLWLVGLLALAVNFVYDIKWSLLLSNYNWLLIGSGVLFALATVLQSNGDGWIAAVVSILGSVAILGGLYALLWRLSGGRWVGEGDIYLGAGLALFLADWRLAFIALFASNLIGTLIVLPGMLLGRLKKGSHVPFGPLLIAGSLIAWFFGSFIIEWYYSLVFLT